MRRARPASDVSIPRGGHDGTRLRLRGLGGPGNPPGDLFVRVAVALPVTDLDRSVGFYQDAIGLRQHSRDGDVAALWRDVPTGAELYRRIFALPGFGKREIGSPRVIELLKGALESEVAAAPGIRQGIELGNLSFAVGGLIVAGLPAEDGP